MEEKQLSWNIQHEEQEGKGKQSLIEIWSWGEAKGPRQPKVEIVVSLPTQGYLATLTGHGPLVRGLFYSGFSSLQV